jgi:phosphopantetheinyl transferase
MPSQPLDSLRLAVMQVAIMLNRHGEVCGDVEEQQQQIRNLVSRLVEQQERQRQQQQEDEDSDFD